VTFAQGSLARCDSGDFKLWLQNHIIVEVSPLSKVTAIFNFANHNLGLTL